MSDLRARLPVSGSGRPFDLACGTGQIAFPMAPYFEKVVAIDQEDDVAGRRLSPAGASAAPRRSRRVP